MNKLKRLFLLFLLVCSLTAFMTIANASNNNVLALNDNDIVVTCGTSDGKSSASPNSSNLIDIVVSLSQTPTQTITVFCHTEDRTAIAEAGDYSAISTSIEFSPTTGNTQHITIGVYNKTNIVVDGTYPYFLFKIDSTSMGSISSTQNTVTCYMKANYSFKTKSYTDGSYNFFALDEYESYYTAGEQTGAVGHSATVTYSYKSKESYRNYVESGLCSEYVSISCDEFDETSMNNSDFTLMLYPTTNSDYYYMRTIYDTPFPVAGDVYFDQDCLYKIMVEHKSPCQKYYSSGSSEPWDSYNDDYINNPSKIDNHTKNTLYYTMMNGHQMCWIPIDYKNYKDNVTVYMRNYCSYIERTYEKLRLYYAVIDRTNPQMLFTETTKNKTSSSRTEVYADQSSFYVDGNLRLIIRFSEPIQIVGEGKSGRNPYITAKIENQECKFDYIAGNKTNTLVFQANLDEFKWINEDGGASGQIYKSFSKITVQLDDLNLMNATNIADLAINTNRKPNYFSTASSSITSYPLGKVKNLNLDYRTATLVNDSVESKPKANIPSNHYDITMTVSNFAYGTVYWSWELQGETPKYDNSKYFNAYSAIQEAKSSGDGDSGQTLSEQSFSFTQDKLSGDYYLNVKVVTIKKKVTTYTFGYFTKNGETDVLTHGWYFDNVAPTVTNVTEIGTNTSRQMTMIFENDHFIYSSVIDHIDILISEDSSFENATAKTIYKIAGSTYTGCKKYNSDELRLDAYDYSPQTPYSVTTKITLTALEPVLGLKEDVFDTTNGILLEPGKYCGWYYICFRIYDSAGNCSEDSKISKLRYDIRTTFDSEETYGNGCVQLISDLDDSVYELEGFSVKYKMTDPSQVGSFGIASCKRGDEVLYDAEELTEDGFTDFDWQSALEPYFDIQILNATEFEIVPKMNGYYEITLAMFHTLDFTVSANVYSFYISNQGNDNTANYYQTTQGLVLVNRVFMLGNQFYYRDTTSVIKIENYANTSYSAAFSSESVAKEYLKYYELQDLYMIQLDTVSASSLNGKTGNTSYIKAPNEKTAQAGEWWIRYKSTDWVTNSTAAEWVYYYYTNNNKDKTINVNKLSDSLNKAIDYVVNYLFKQGKWVNLVGEEYIDVTTNAPMLNPSQIHTEFESIAETRCGSVYASENKFDGDPIERLYSNNVEVNGKSLPLAANLMLKISDCTRLFYAEIIKNKAPSYSDYTEVKASNGTSLGKAIGTVESGTYRIIELGEEGMHSFDVYIDYTAPSISVTKVDKNGNVETTILDKTIDGQVFNSYQFTVGAFTKEIDPMAYAVVYTRTGKILNTYFADDLEDGVELENGVYNLEIGDRSGNLYKITLQINDVELEVTANVIEGTGVQVVCNREEEDIQKYIISVNGERVNKENYYQRKTYTESGIYKIYVLDYYGSSVELSCEFIRPYPEVLWYYRTGVDADMMPIENNESDYAKIVNDADIENKFYITTSSYLTLKFDSSCIYEFQATGVKTFEHTTTSSGKYTTLRINTLTSWTLKIAYQAYPDVYSIYVCQVEATAPTIKGTYRMNSIVINDMEGQESENYLDSLEDGTVLIPSTLKYSTQLVNDNILYNGSTVYTDYIKLSITDESGVKSVQAFINGVEIKQEDMEINTKGYYIFHDYGEYKIIATDVFGNRVVYTFTNNNIPFGEYIIDDVEQSSYLNVDTFGNSYIEHVLYEDGEALYRIVIGDKVYFYYFDIKDNNIYTYDYIVANSDRSGKFTQLSRSATPLYEAKNGTIEKNIWSRIIDEKDLFDIKVMIDKDSNTCIKITMYTKLLIESRVSGANSFEPLYNNTELSKELSDVDLAVNGDVVVTNRDGNIVKISGAPVVNEDTLELNKIKKIEVSYSPVNVYSSYTTIYDGGEVAEFSYDQNGFYSMIITNIYGNVTTYLFNMSTTFSVIFKAIYSDNTENYYSETYNNTIRSNNNVEFTVYTSGVRLFLNGSEVAPIKLQDTVYYFSISNNGKYDFHITNEYGFELFTTIEINTSLMDIDNDVFSGFCDKADKENGYTKDVLSINQQLLSVEDDYEVAYISITHGKETKVIYDVLSQVRVELDNEKLNNCIGMNENGEYEDGDYVVLFRNTYGAPAYKTIHYLHTPAITVSRMTKTDLGPKKLDLEDVIQNGAWCNNLITVSTVATSYTLLVNNKRSECPKEFVLTSVTGSASYSYNVDYSDQYGFEYSFVVNLLRRDIEVKLNENVTTVDIAGILTTRQNPSFKFTEDASCTYTLDGVTLPYEQDQTINRDGLITIHAEDKAGNYTNYYIDRDTYCDFLILEGTSVKGLLNGGIATTSCKFTALDGDTCTIKKVFINSELQKNWEGNSFTDPGKYELVIEDQVGNVSYFAFYLITTAICKFEYTTPYEYKITELWYEDSLMTKDKIKQNYLDLVDQSNDHYSSILVVDNEGYHTNGVYSAVMTSLITGESYNFSFTIDNTPPDAILVGCDDGDTTTEEITLAKVNSGDRVQVYRNGDLISDSNDANTATIPTITDGGEYKIVVTNAAGVQKTLTFNKLTIVNAAGSVFITIIILLLITALMIGLLLRNRSKVDK